MIRILYLTFNAPPVKNVASFRTEAYLKYLPEHQITVDVLTRHYTDASLVSVDFEMMKSDSLYESDNSAHENIHYTGFYNYVNHSKYYSKTRKVFRVLSNLYLVDPYYYGWKKIALDYFETHLKDKHYDLIVATYNPLITFVVAQKLSKKYNIPWIAEFRDSFITEEDQGRPFLFKKIVQAKALEGASKVIVVSEGIREQIKRSLIKKQSHLPIDIIRNGYDESVKACVNPADQNIWEVFSTIKKNYKKILVHTGTIYEKQNIQFFIEGIKKFNQGNEGKVALLLIGLNKDGMIFNPLLEKDVYLLPKVENETSLAMQTEADILIFPSWYSHRYTGFVAKVFEYLWHGKPVWGSPNPPRDFSDFILQYPQVTIFNDLQELLAALAKNITFEQVFPNKALRDQLTRKYWMNRLADQIKMIVQH